MHRCLSRVEFLPQYLTARFLFCILVIMVTVKPTEKKTRFSKQRVALLELLSSTKEHPTAAWLYQNLRKDFPSISLGTVYRNLSLLAEQGKIQILRNGSGFDRFDANVSDHSHITCTVCGKVADLDSEIPGEDNAERIAEEASGFRVFSHKLDFYGICPECLRAQENAGE